MGHQAVTRKNLEWLVISGVVENPSLLHNLSVEAEDFSEAAWAFDLLSEMIMSGEAVDAVLFGHYIVEKNKNMLGTWCLNYDPMVIDAMVNNYAKRLKKMSLVENLDKTIEESKTQETSIRILNIQDAIQNMNVTTKGRKVSIEEGLKEGFSRIEKCRESGGMTGVPTGFRKIDEILGGWQNQLTVIAGRPAMGKSSFSLTTALYAAENGFGVYYLTAEESIEAIVTRIQSQFSKIPVEELMRANFPDSDWGALSKTIGRASGLDFHIEEIGSIPIEETCAKIRTHKAQNETDLVVVDHLQCLFQKSRKEQLRHHEVSYITQSLKNISTDLKIPVILVSQLSRIVEHGTDKRPLMSHLKESGDIEQIADVVGLLYRPNYYDSTKDEREANLNIAKNRQGRTGGIKLCWDGPRTTFRNWDDSWSI